MARNMTPREELHDLANQWEAQERQDPHAAFRYSRALDEILFHGDLRFTDYAPYRNEGPFAARLRKWLKNVSDPRDTKALFKLLTRLFFVDRLQMTSLYRDAYRRIIVPWVSREALTAEDMLSPDYEGKVRSLLRGYRLFSVTQSFKNPDFLSANDLSGLAKPGILGEDPGKVTPDGLASRSELKGIIVLEDFVGTGRQAGAVLARVAHLSSPQWRLLFVPLIILARGLRNLQRRRHLGRFDIRPVLEIPVSSCVQKTPQSGEHDEFKRARPVVESTASRVLEPYNQYDDPPKHPYGYGACGALLVTCHNTPNNSLPLIHHRAPGWSPLFRRIHHSKDGLR